MDAPGVRPKSLSTSRICKRPRSGLSTTPASKASSGVRASPSGATSTNCSHSDTVSPSTSGPWPTSTIHGAACRSLAWRPSLMSTSGSLRLRHWPMAQVRSLRPSARSVAGRGTTCCTAATGKAQRSCPIRNTAKRCVPEPCPGAANVAALAALAGASSAAAHQAWASRISRATSRMHSMGAAADAGTTDSNSSLSSGVWCTVRTARVATGFTPSTASTRTPTRAPACWSTSSLGAPVSSSPASGKGSQRSSATMGTAAPATSATPSKAPLRRGSTARPCGGSGSA